MNYKIIFIAFFISIFILFFAADRHIAYAFLTRDSGTDTCGRINLQTTETPFCPALGGGGTNDNVSHYSMTVTITSTSRRAHTFTYHALASMCTGPYLDASGYCRDNTTNTGSIQANTPFSLTIDRAPIQSSFCGSYQHDFYIEDVDGDTGCTYVQNNASGVAGRCETGYDCANPPLYSISGNVFNDINKDLQLNNGERNYTNGINITSSGGTVSTSNGSFTISGLTTGTYTVSYTNLPTGYYMGYPKNGPPPSFSVTVGQGGCTVDTTTGASCNNGNVTNLNFAITNSLPWFQAIGSDIRQDNGITSAIPATAACGGTSGPYAIMSNGNSPGVAFSGDTDPSLGQGQASTNNWLVGTTTYPEVYTPATSGIIKTSYTYLSAVAKQAGVTPTNLANTCSLTGCSLPANFAHGLYLANTNLTLTGAGYTFGANQNYVILVHGDLTIKEPLHVPVGSTVTFSASGNIYVDPTVGETVSTSIVTDLEGIYSSDNSFFIQGTPNICAANGRDRKLNIAGAVIVNAGLQGGSFQNQRDLCGQNPSCPTIQLRQRPDFLLNLPIFLMQTSATSQEVTP